MGVKHIFLEMYEKEESKVIRDGTFVSANIFNKVEGSTLS